MIVLLRLKANRSLQELIIYTQKSFGIILLKAPITMTDMSYIITEKKLSSLQVSGIQERIQDRFERHGLILLFILTLMRLNLIVH